MSEHSDVSVLRLERYLLSAVLCDVRDEDVGGEEKEDFIHGRRRTVANVEMCQYLTLAQVVLIPQRGDRTHQLSSTYPCENHGFGTD